MKVDTIILIIGSPKNSISFFTDDIFIDQKLL